MARDISERKASEGRVNEYQKRLKAMASQLTITEEKARRRIAADLHDNIGQTLVFSRMQIARAQKITTKSELAAILDETSRSLLSAIQETKDLIFDLSSPLLGNLGLSAAISNFLEVNVMKKHEIKVEFADNNEIKYLSSDLKTILFYNVRELLINVIKHAQAMKLIVSIESDEKELKICVLDDGIGFGTGEEVISIDSHDGFGLLSIKERIEDFGGSLEIMSWPGKGSKATMIAPFNMS